MYKLGFEPIITKSTGLNGSVRIETRKKSDEKAKKSKSTGLNGSVRIETRHANRHRNGHPKAPALTGR